MSMLARCSDLCIMLLQGSSCIKITLVPNSILLRLYLFPSQKTLKTFTVARVRDFLIISLTYVLVKIFHGLLRIPYYSIYYSGVA